MPVNSPPRPRVDSEHISFLAGMRIIRPNKSPHKYSGYQVVRLATEIIPTYSALLGMYNLNGYNNIKMLIMFNKCYAAIE